MHANRDDIRWELGDLYSGYDDTRIEADLAKAHKLAEEFASNYRTRVASLAPSELLTALNQLEDIYTLGYKPSSFASLAFSADTQDPRLQALVARTREETTQTFNQLVFFDVELKIATNEQYARFLSAPELAEYHHFLTVTRAFAPHTLSEPEERLLAQTRLTGASAWSQLYTEITSNLRFPIEVDGETKQMTDAEVRALRSEPDRDLRKRAGETLFTTYEKNSHVLNYVFNTLFQDHKLAIGMRRYQQPIEPTALENELSPDLVELLMTTTEANYGIAQEYYRLKSRLLGLDGDFRYHDVLAPYTKEEPKYDFDDARTLVLDAFGQFDPRLRDIAEKFFAQRWIDAMPRPGKRGGAFCAGLLPAYHPYVLTNFTGRLEDVFTIAHELGHGIHFYLARQQNVMNFDPTTPMAEVASVFGEILLADYLRKRPEIAQRSAESAENEAKTNMDVDRIVLGKMIEDAIATIYRQVMYTRWEQRAHARRALGVATADEYSALWMEENNKLYGDAIAFDALDRWGWIAIPHFVSYRFYCFSYAFAHLVTFALYKKYGEEPASFPARYIELLASGGRDRPDMLLKTVGLDAHDPDFWQHGFDLLRGMLSDFKKTAESDNLR